MKAHHHIITLSHWLIVALLILNFQLSTFNCFAQQVQLKGVVTVQNSKTNTGKTQFVKNAEVEHINQNNAKTKDVTGDDGKFSLNIKGANANTQTQIYVTPFGEFADYVVVNEKELKDITLGRLTPVSVFVCRKGELEKRQAEMVGINMRKLEEKMEADKKRLQKELDAIRANNDYLNVRYSAIKDSLDIISKNIDNAFERIKEYAKTMTLENLDDRDENYVKAYACFSRGVLDSVSYYLKEHELDLKYQKIVQLQQESKKEKELAAILTESAKAKEEFTENSLNELIKQWLLLARTADMQNDYEKAMLYYEKVIQADTMIFDNIFEYANYLSKIKKYAKAENYYLQLLDFFRKNAADNPRQFIAEVSNVLNNIAFLHVKINRYEEARREYEEALKIRKKLADDNPDLFNKDVAETLNNLALLHELTNEYSNALQEYEDALQIYRVLANENPTEYLYYVARTLNNFGILHNANNEYQKALEKLEEALEIQRKLTDENPKKHTAELSRTLNNLAVLYRNMKRNSDALQKFEEALKLRRELAAENPRIYLQNVAITLTNFALLHIALKENESAMQKIEESLRLFRELSVETPKTYLSYLATSLGTLAYLHKEMNNLENALLYFGEALNINKNLADENPKVYLSEVARTLNNLGLCHYDNYEYEKASEKYAEALVIWRELVSKNPKAYLPNVALSLNNLGNLHTKINKYSEALAEFEEALKIRKELAAENPKTFLPLVAITYVAIAENFLFTKQYIQTEQNAKEALKIINDYSEAKINLAHALLFQNRFSEAETIYKEVADSGDTYIQSILDDFDALEQANAIPEERKAEVEKMREKLKVENGER